MPQNCGVDWKQLVLNFTSLENVLVYPFHEENQTKLFQDHYHVENYFGCVNPWLVEH